MRKSIQVENDYISSFYDIVSIQSPNLLDPSKQNLQYVLLQGKRTLCKSTVLCLSLHRSRESSTYIIQQERVPSSYLHNKNHVVPKYIHLTCFLSRNSIMSRDNKSSRYLILFLLLPLLLFFIIIILFFSSSVYHFMSLKMMIHQGVLK